MFFPTLRQIATQDVVCVDIRETVADAIAKMHAYNHRNVIVSDAPNYYVFTTQDIIEITLKEISLSAPFSSLHLRMIPVLHKEVNIINALEHIGNDHDYICVFDDDGSLFGLVTSNDIIASVDPQIMLDNLTLGSMLDIRYGFVTVSHDTPMRKAIQTMHQDDTDCIIVAEGEHHTGIVTAKDLLKYFSAHSGAELPVSHYMSTPLLTMPPESSISEALSFLQSNHVKRIIVARPGENVAGIISEQELISRTYLKWSSLVKNHFSEFEELTQILSQKNKQLAKMATRDQLTGVANRHFFEELFEKSHAEAKRYERPLSLVIIDIDRFKSINDTYGHNIGDAVLSSLAALVSSSIRGADVFARWGGEEFVLLLPNTSAEQARTATENLRARIAAHTFDTVGNITASFGVTEVMPDEPLKATVERADRSLYEAKSSGRNRVVCSSDLAASVS